MALTICKGKNKQGGPCGMRPPSGKDWCIRHQGGAAEAPPAAAAEKKPAAAKGGAAGLSGVAAAGLGVALGVLGVCVWLVFRPAAPAPQKRKAPQLRVA